MVSEKNLSKSQNEFKNFNSEEKTNLEDIEREEVKDDTSIEISKKKRDTESAGIPVEDKN
jgi:hypothetical protein